MFHLSVFNCIPCFVAHDLLFYFENGPVGVSLTFLWWSSFPALIVSTCYTLPVCVYIVCIRLCLVFHLWKAAIAPRCQAGSCACVVTLWSSVTIVCILCLIHSFLFFVFDCFLKSDLWLLLELDIPLLYEWFWFEAKKSWTPCLRTAIGSVVTRQNKNEMFRQNVKKKTFIAVVMLRKPERYKHPGKCSHWVEVSNQITFKSIWSSAALFAWHLKQWYFWNNRYK